MFPKSHLAGQQKCKKIKLKKKAAWTGVMGDLLKVFTSVSISRFFLNINTSVQRRFSSDRHCEVI